MRILVTGAAGFIGGAVAALASARGYHVVGTARRARPEQSSPTFPIIALDLHDPLAVVAAIERVRPQVIVNAAWSDVSNHAGQTASTALADVAVAVTLVEAGAQHGLERFVGVGSQAEYGAMDGAMNENAPLNPKGWYGAAKVAAYYLAREQCARSGVSFAWARMFSAYGPGDRPTWLIPTVMREIAAGRSPRTTSGEQLWDYLFIDDVAAAIVALCETQSAVGPFNLGSGRARRVRSIVEAIRDKMAPDLTLVFGDIPHRPDQIWHMEADITKLQSSTGWTPKVEMDQGLTRTIEACRATA